MKIFGKRKSSAVTSSASETAATSAASAGGGHCTSTISTPLDNEDVPSYFARATTNGGSSSKKKKQRHDHDAASNQKPNGDDIQALLAMDPSKLNSKQRRLVRRHQEREGIEESNAVESTENASSSSIHEEQIASRGTTGDESVEAIASNQPQSASTTSTTTTATDILAKLEGLNSKDRRKFLRQLRSSVGETIDESLIAAAEEQARKVAERNEQEAAKTNIKCDEASKLSRAKVSVKTSTHVEDAGTVDTRQTKPKSKRRKKNPINFDDLDPEERKRREAQRTMQKEAADRRASGLVDPDRHPLNSERRRANRRKPGKAAKIVQAKKEQLAERGKFNAVGYQMRKKGGT